MIHDNVKNEEVPIACRLDRTRQVFRITRNRGKSLANGGFGFSLPNGDNDNESSSTAEYLFIEEVYFLVERGLLEAYDDHDTRLTIQGMFQLLPMCGMSLPALLVYAHVRSQNYRVIRHTPHRRRILQQMEPLRHLYKRRKRTPTLETQETEGPPQSTTTTTTTITSSTAEPTTTSGRTKLEHLRQELREDAARASAPVLGSPTIAYELYEPDSQFRRTCPGLPDIYVTATSLLQFDALQTLLREADGIPLRTAVVSEAGTVVMLGVTDFGVPAMAKPVAKSQTS